MRSRKKLLGALRSALAAKMAMQADNCRELRIERAEE